ncbi:MAG: hypothetical protein SF051_09260 [Elusimicrobiota bacterium]|nr:hypothetical protein [Elusimicrobiota bacterium]
MTRRLARLLLVTALLYGSGAYWAALQTYGWATMLVERVESQGVAGAVSSTFDGKSPCGVCIVVDKASRPAQPERVAAPAVHLIAVAPVAFVPAPRRAGRVPRTAARSFAPPERPVSPPPKALPAA